MFKKILIANRGAIACRIIRTLRHLGIASVAVYSEADRNSLHVELADEVVSLGGSPAAESYLRADKLLEAARCTGAEAIHPGYGFLSENAAFAESCEQAGIVFIGPTPAQMRDFGLKHRARALAKEHGVPLLPGSELLAGVEHACSEAEIVGYPVMLKSTAGGGGIGMQLCRDAAELAAAYASVERLAKNNFSDGGLFLEKYIERARHIEVQLFGDGAGSVVALGERDCSMQRRNQKVIEETPAPGLSEITRAAMLAAAVRLGSAVGYRSAGTVEFVFDAEAGEFYFLEVNTRLQVEHGVTEEVTGVDLVEWMIRVAAGERPALDFSATGHSIQVRLYAEDPARNFRPSSGLLSFVSLPSDVRVDGWIETGAEVSAFYDPLLAKIIVHAPTRAEAVEKLERALAHTAVHGIETNLDYLRRILREPVFRSGQSFTRFLSSLDSRSPTIEVLSAGTHATVQDYPGRLGYWNVGVPPSGPMDHYAFRLANRIVGNAEGIVGLELTSTGPTLKFSVDATIALTGAVMKASLNGDPVEYWKPISVSAGSVLKMGAIQSAGQRTYLAIAGGFDIPEYMGSRATFTLGKFGGHAGRALRAGDVLRVATGVPRDSLPFESAPASHVALAAPAAPITRNSPIAPAAVAAPITRTLPTAPAALTTHTAPIAPTALTALTTNTTPAASIASAARVHSTECSGATPAALIPAYTSHWDIAVIYGPHGAPDFFTESDIDTFFTTDWQVHYNSSRTGVRLIGPKPEWARADGGEAGLHPSNIHDNAYAVGTIDYTGDMPVILGPDGPSLGGFVCPATIALADLWKIGQLRPGDTIRFYPITTDEAVARQRAQDEDIANLSATSNSAVNSSATNNAATNSTVNSSATNNAATNSTVNSSATNNAATNSTVNSSATNNTATNSAVNSSTTNNSATNSATNSSGATLRPATRSANASERNDALLAETQPHASLRTARSLANRTHASGRDNAHLIPTQHSALRASQLTSPILHLTKPKANGVGVCYRQAGEDYLLIEYGPPVLDLELRFRAHALMQWLEQHKPRGIIDLTPGIRSLQVHYDCRVITQRALLDVLLRAEDELASSANVQVPSRIVHLPLSWDDPATRIAIEKYTQSVRPDAPWCPSNIEFIRRINGLESINEVRRIVFDASYLVLGLGDVYLGAPVATPLDPRHRLVTTKYNPARTWTPENAVGIGGAYLCVYGMEGPGGYQFVGRTVQMWNRYRQTADFQDGRQWLLRFFDQIRFYPVEADELARMREDFPRGRLKLRIEPALLDIREYRSMLAREAESIGAFKSRQQAAFEAERDRWKAADARVSGNMQGDGSTQGDSNAQGDRHPGSGAISREAGESSLCALDLTDRSSNDVPPGCTAVSSPVTGSVWQLNVSTGQRVSEGDELLIVEAMKMEIPITAEASAEVVEVRCARGRTVTAGETLVVLRAV